MLLVHPGTDLCVWDFGSGAMAIVINGQYVFHSF